MTCMSIWQQIPHEALSRSPAFQAYAFRDPPRKFFSLDTVQIISQEHEGPSTPVASLPRHGVKQHEVATPPPTPMEGHPTARRHRGPSTSPLPRPHWQLGELAAELKNRFGQTTPPSSRYRSLPSPPWTPTSGTWPPQRVVAPVASQLRLAADTSANAIHLLPPHAPEDRPHQPRVAAAMRSHRPLTLPSTTAVTPRRSPARNRLAGLQICLRTFTTNGSQQMATST